ncbi:MAG: hypothetical protein M3308_00505 [Actinomycetota bacterium]|nr:hypothetical protein [Actinomycetota bacterium]
MVTTEQWLAAHLDDQAADEATRPVRDDAEPLDPMHVADQAALDAAARDADLSSLLTCSPPASSRGVTGAILFRRGRRVPGRARRVWPGCVRRPPWTWAT